MKSRKLLSLLLILALALGMSFALVSCGDTDDDDTSFMEDDKEDTKEDDSAQTPGLKFATNPDGTYRITKYVSDGTTKNLVIDKEHENAIVTKIDARAFENVSILESISIPDSITTIGDYAFAGCTGLGEIVIPESVSSIGSHAFYGCDKISNIVIKDYEDKDDSIALSIGDYAFAGCTSLKGVGNATDGFVFTVAERVVSIGKAAFFGCENITALALPGSLVSIGESAFQNCAALATVTSAASSKLEFIGANAFRSCSSISEFTVPAGVKTIGHDAFRDCTSLAVLNLNSSLKSVGSYAFYGCSNLKTVNAPDIESWLEISFVDVYANPIYKGAAKLYVNSTLVENINTGSASEVGSYSFYMYPHLKSVIFTDSVKSIGRCAFYNTGITEVDVKNGVESIGEYAFSECNSLAVITLGTGLKTLNRAAFADCQALTTIIFNAVKMADMKANNMVFANADGITVMIGPGVTYIPAYFLYSANDTSKLPTISSVSFIGESSCLGIGEAAFKNMAVGVVLPACLESIGAFAFENVAMPSITIGENIKFIGTGAFAGCKAQQIHFLAKNMADLAPANRVFENVGKSMPVPLNIGSLVQRIPANLLYSTASQSTCPKVGSVNTTGATFTSIGEGAFKFFTFTEAIALPESLTSIGAGAFEGSLIDEIAIPDATTFVGERAFADCVWLTKVSIGAGLTLITPDYFTGSYKINTLTVSTANEVYASESNCIIDSESRTVVLGCLKSTIPQGLIPGTEDYKVVAIGNNAFLGCTGLKSITIPANITSIGDNAFRSSGIEAITIPDSVTTIGTSAFADCSAAVSLSIGKGLSYINPLCFLGCTSLESITVSAENETLASVSNCVVNKGKTTLYLGCKSSDLSVDDLAALSSINDNAFAGCTGLVSIQIPASVSSIGSSAFAGCSSLSSIVVPDSVFSIYADTFTDCASLASVTLGTTLSDIAEGAFAGCTALDTITVKEGNTSFAVINGCLVNISSGIIITACKDFDISTDMMYNDAPLYPIIGSGAFAGRDDITSITFSKNYIGINGSAFKDCENLTQVILPASIGILGDNVFEGCSNLKIYFEATEPYDSFGNYNPDNLPAYFYSENEPTVEGSFWHYDDQQNIVLWD